MMFRSGKDERGGRNTSNYGRGSGNGSGGNGLSYGSASDFSGSRQNARGGSNRAKVLPKRHGKSETVVSLQPIVWSKESLVPISKNFYSEHQNVARRSQYEIDAWYQENQVTIEGYDIPRPVFDFSEADFPAPIVQRLFKSFQKPTVIQSISWPLALSGRDLVSIAKTGSGKTLAFVLPALVHIMGQPSRGHPKYPLVLVLLPTRELAQQVQEVSRDYCQILNLSLTCLFGGAPKNSQLYDLQRGVDLVIATPGRLMDFLTAGKTSLKRCTYLVLDEADRMLDMGFEPQIRKIISQIRPDRQTLMFSATWPREVRKLASDFLTNVAHLNVGSLELSANHNITQIVEIIDEGNKQQRLISILNQIMDEDDCKTIIFVETKRKADDLTRWMRRDGWPALCIHGDKGQSERDWALGEFKAGKTPILLATDVAARGLDVDDIKYVINYDYSNNSEDYVHRIGRTGRREKKGTAYTFFTHENSAKAKDLIKVLQEANQHVPDELTLMAQSTSSTSNRSRYGGGLKRNFSGDGGHSGFFAKRGRFEDRREGRPWEKASSNTQMVFTKAF